MKTKIGELIIILYFILAGVYSLYAVITETGLASYMLSLQFNMLGFASDKLTAVLCIIVLYLPVTPFLRFFPNVQRWFWGGMASRQIMVAGEAGQRRQPFSSAWLGALFVIPAIIGVAAQYYMTEMNAREASVRVGIYNAENDAGLVPSDAQIVNATGVLQEKLAYVIEREGTGQKSRTLFVPFTGSKWTQAMPVHAVVKFELTGSATSVWLENNVLIAEVFKDGPPVHAREEWEKYGIHIAKNAILLEHRWTSNGKLTPKFSEFDMLGYVNPVTAGLFVGGLFLFAGLLANLLSRRRR